MEYYSAIRRTEQFIQTIKMDFKGIVLSDNMCKLLKMAKVERQSTYL